MSEMKLQKIGVVRREESTIIIKLETEFKNGLINLDKFSHVHILWWADGHEDEKSRQTLVTELPYAPGEEAGVFACRAEYRPNPIAITICPIIAVDMKNGVVKVAGIDARNNTPVLDLKPYIPVCDRVHNSTTPNWFEGWPQELPETGLQLEY